jgi:hypothetical protein
MKTTPAERTAEKAIRNMFRLWQIDRKLAGGTPVRLRKGKRYFVFFDGRCPCPDVYVYRGYYRKGQENSPREFGWKSPRTGHVFAIHGDSGSLCWISNLGLSRCVEDYSAKRNREVEKLARVLLIAQGGLVA